MPAHDAAADDFVSVAGGGNGCSAGWLALALLHHLRARIGGVM